MNHPHLFGACIFPRRSELHEIETSTFPIINTDAERYLNIGAGLFSLGKSQEAVACYQRAAEINPNNAEIYYNMGVVLNRQGKPEAAIVCYCKALKISPNTPLWSRQETALLEWT